MALKTLFHEVEFCVIGGGLAGMGAAISAARHGIKTLLMHERPVPGGNASSEIRMWVCGSKLLMETGLVEELRLENRYRNNTANYSIWDSITYEFVGWGEDSESAYIRYKTDKGGEGVVYFGFDFEGKAIWIIE